MNETILQEVGLIRAQLQQIQDNQEVGKLENDKGIISLTDELFFMRIILQECTKCMFVAQLSPFLSSIHLDTF